MRDCLDVPVSAPASACAGDMRRREWVQCVAAACLLPAAGGACGQPAGPDPAAPRLRWARRAFEELVFAASLLGLDARAAFVNMAINRCIDYALDPPSARGGDLWSTPFETLTRGAGDCEDFAIAKFYLLIASGAPREGVRLLYAFRRWPDRTARPLPHLVTVTGWPLADPRVLDCINPLAVPLSQRDDLEPLFSFDESAIWPGLDTVALTGRRIDRWQATQLRTLRQAQDGRRTTSGTRMRPAPAFSSTTQPCSADTFSPCLPPRPPGTALRSPQARS